MSGYSTWHDLLDDGPSSSVPLPPAEEESPAESVESSLSESDLPPEVRRLLAERERLEADFKALVGEGPPAPDADRMRQMYPVPVHTKETRIEERRQRRREELQRLALLRAAERRAVAARAAEAAAESRQQALLELQQRREREEQWLLDRRTALEKRAKARKGAAEVEEERQEEWRRLHVAPRPKEEPARREPAKKEKPRRHKRPVPATPPQERQAEPARKERPKVHAAKTAAVERPKPVRRREARVLETRFERRDRERWG